MAKNKPEDSDTRTVKLLAEKLVRLAVSMGKKYALII